MQETSRIGIDFINSVCGYGLLAILAVLVLLFVLNWAKSREQGYWRQGTKGNEIYNAVGNEKVLVEASAHAHQRTTGREHGGTIEVYTRPPKSFDGKLALRSLKQNGAIIHYTNEE